MTPQQLSSVLEEFGLSARNGTYLVVSRAEPPLPLKQSFPDGSSVEWLCHVCSAEDLVAVKRADLGIVFDQLEHMQKEEGANLLSRLRDQHSTRVLLHCANPVHSKQELMTLGYIEQRHQSVDGSFYLCDPELFTAT